MSRIKISTRCLSDDLPKLPKNVQEGFFEKIEVLAENPLYGKPLHGELKILRSLPLGRYRIIYYYLRDDDIVWIIATGIRKEGSKEDIYERVTRLLDSGDLMPD